MVRTTIVDTEICFDLFKVGLFQFATTEQRVAEVWVSEQVVRNSLVDDMIVK